MFKKLSIVGGIILLLILSFGVPTQSKSDAVLKSKMIFQDGTNIIVSEEQDGGILFKSVGAHQKKQKVLITVDDFKPKKKIKNGFIEGWHKDDFGIYTIVQIPIIEQGGRLSFDVELSETCVGCATGATSKTQTGMINGSWINFSNPMNATAATITFAALSTGGASANWINTSQPYRVTLNGLANRTSQEYVFLNITNATGTNNNTHIFLNGFGYNNLSGIEVYGSNGSRLNFTLFWNISQNINQTAELVINRTDNLTPNIYYGTTHQLNLSNMSRTFDVYGADFNDLTCGIWSGGDCSEGTLSVSSTINMDTQNKYKNLTNTVWRYRANQSDVQENMVRFWRSDTGVGATGMSNYWQVSNVFRLTNDGSNIILSGGNFPKSDWNDIKIQNYGTTWSLYLNGLLVGTSTSAVDDAANYWVMQYINAVTYDEIATYTNNFANDGTWGTQETYSAGGNDAFMYAIPAGHPMSELKNTSASSVLINLTLTAGTPLQNIQLFSNSSTFTGTATISFTNNTETLIESASGGYYYLNKTVNLSEYSTGIWLNDTIADATFNDAATKGVITNISSNPNITGTTRTGTYINTSYSALPANTVINLNYTIPYDYLAVLSQPANQTAGNGSALTHSITVTDNDYLSQNVSWDFTNDGIIDAYGLSVQNTYNLNGTFNGTVRVNTSTTIPGWDNQSKPFTTTINNTATITSWGNNQTNNQSLTINLTAISTLNFNATADQLIDTWSWFIDGVNQSNNADTFNYSFSSSKTVKVNATNANGTSNTVTWTVTQSPSTGITRETKLSINQINWTAVSGDAYGYVCVYTNRTVYINTTGCTQQ